MYSSRNYFSPFLGCTCHFYACYSAEINAGGNMAGLPNTLLVVVTRNKDGLAWRRSKLKARIYYL